VQGDQRGCHPKSQAIDEEAAIAWLDAQLHTSTASALSLASWILDTDTTVKCLYGKQEGAVVGYNPQKKAVLPTTTTLVLWAIPVWT
jgi:hypothetical protein